MTAELTSEQCEVIQPVRARVCGGVCAIKTVNE